jgi:hypothetical protein
MEEIYSLELQRCSLEFVISVFKIYIWDLANSFWDHVFQISFLEWWTFRIYIPNCEKNKSFLETYTPYIQILILIFKEQLCVSGMDFCFLYW